MGTSFPRQIALRLRSERGRLASLVSRLTHFFCFLSFSWNHIYIFTEGPAYGIMEVLDFLYIKSCTKKTKKRGYKAFFALYPGDDERSESAP